MKNKIFCALLFVVMTLPAFAQDEDRKKPVTKDFTAEVNFNPFSSNPVNINYLRFRYFLTDQSSLRIGFSVGMEKQTPQEDVTRKTFDISIRPGYEWHLVGTERLSPYFGVEAEFSVKKSSFEDEDSDAYVEKIDGAWSESGIERGFTRIGLNFIVGADFYVAKRVYLGTEFGFGFQNTKTSEIKVTTPDDLDPIESSSSFQLGPNFNSSLRLGFVF